MKITKNEETSHTLHVPHRGTQLGVFSDIHWDNPKCDRKLLKKHLDYCLKNEIPIIIPGDLFCLMQGKYDPRRSKKDIRIEHNVANYLDAVIEDAVKYFKPYKSIIKLIGYGNHETAILRALETDPLKNFVKQLNGDEPTVELGGYGGWLNVSNNRTSCIIKYFHGSGGGGIVTRGEINLTRALEMYEGMDVFIMGHVHENKATNIRRESVTLNNKTVKQRSIHMMISGTYKEEYGTGAGGYHIEKGRPPKPIGGRILDIRFASSPENLSHVTSSEFPIL